MGKTVREEGSRLIFVLARTLDGPVLYSPFFSLSASPHIILDRAHLAIVGIALYRNYGVGEGVERREKEQERRRKGEGKEKYQ
jgi:hypothetical protein